MKCVVFMLLVLVQVNVSYQQHILTEHKRRHCKALQTSDIMEHALPEIRRILQAEAENTRRLLQTETENTRRLLQAEPENTRRQHGEFVFASALRGSILVRCGTGWVYYDNNCYWFSQTSKTWEEAIEICENKNSYLADIRSDEENRFVKMKLISINEVMVLNYHYYLGGHLTEGKWTWRRSGEFIGYTDWAPKEPNNHKGVESCLSLQGSSAFKWNDVECTATNVAFICKKRVEHEVYP
ncbi:perlucin-like protein isoform X2 [Mizuhopecten yessoensis]|uniref:perlucin-like protein isoform X2 n=1 Tax=Mizuhopecten yessoensis TaxID=6573 RepID=UPI000B45C777|nr:perlucin-like protein isoform X2 [Mizuhopecten yessoensis]